MRQRVRGKSLALIGPAAVILLTPVGSLAVQQTLFNVPSSDVLSSGKVYAELDVSFKPIKPKSSSFVPRFVIGLSGGVEAGLNIEGNIQPGPDSTTLVPTIKWRVSGGGDESWVLVAGDNLFIPTSSGSYTIGNYTYAQLSKTFGSKTRVTAGGYHFTSGVAAENAQRGGGQLALSACLMEGSLLQRTGTRADTTAGTTHQESSGSLARRRPRTSATRFATVC